MALFRKRSQESREEAPELRAAREQMVQQLRAAKDPDAPIPGVSVEASRVVREATDQIGAEYGEQYRIVTGKNFDRGPFHKVHFAGLKELAQTVEFLLEEPEADIFDSPMDREMFIYGTAPNWETIATPSGWPDLDMLFRVAALALHNADTNEQRRSENVWFKAADPELRKLERKAGGTP